MIFHSGGGKTNAIRFLLFVPVRYEIFCHIMLMDLPEVILFAQIKGIFTDNALSILFCRLLFLRVRDHC
jgi:hypothetical protein